MDESTGISICLITLMLVAGLCGMGGCYISEKTKWKAIEAGLVEKEEPSITSKVWTKP